MCILEIRNRRKVPRIMQMEMLMHIRTRSVFKLAIAVLAFTPYVTDGAIVTTSSYQFVGNCSDCAGTAMATLVLQNYTPGSALNNSDFVSLTYSSNLLNFTLLANESPSITGSLPASLPGHAQ